MSLPKYGILKIGALVFPFHSLSAVGSEFEPMWDWDSDRPKIKHICFYIRTQFVPRSKRSPPRLYRTDLLIIIWYNIIYDIILYYIILYYIILYYIILYYIILYYIWHEIMWYMIWYMIYLLTAVGLIPGGSSTTHIYTQTIQHNRHKQYTEQHN